MYRSRTLAPARPSERFESYMFDFTGTLGFNQLAYGPPRWYGVRLQYNLQ